jgi:hypothetical protein
MPDGRVSVSLLAPIRPQRMLSQFERDRLLASADLAGLPDYRNMLALPSRSHVPGPFPSSFTTGTTLPPLADPSNFPFQTAFRGEHVFLLL